MCKLYKVNLDPKYEGMRVNFSVCIVEMFAKIAPLKRGLLLCFVVLFSWALTNEILHRVFHLKQFYFWVRKKSTNC